MTHVIMTNLTPQQLPLFIYCKEEKQIKFEMPFEDLLDNRHHVHLWKTDIRNYSRKQLTALLGLLSAKELKKLQLIKTIEERKRYIIAKATLRQLLSRYHRVNPQKLAFSRNASHKPFLHPNPDSTQFNLTQAKHKILLAFRFNARNTSVGIDMENLESAYDYNWIINKYFHNDEKKAVRESNGRHLFFKFWTRKEALLKAVGTSMLEEMPVLNTAGESNVCDVKNETFHRLTQRPYYLTSFKIGDQYLASLATEGLHVNTLFFDYDYFL